MNISTNGINLIKNFEGCRLTAYRCAAGVWTIGYGHTSGVRSGMTISQAQADAYLREDIRRFESHVQYYDKIYHFNQNQFDALVSFAFNIGSITQLTDSGKRSLSVIADKMLLYNKAGGVVNQGLVNRRKKERELFVSGSTSNTVSNSSVTVPEPTLRTNCKGVRVQQLQTILNKYFNANISVDGIFGKNTRAALINAQKKLFTDPKEHDGIYGPKTYNAIKGVAK